MTYGDGKRVFDFEDLRVPLMADGRIGVDLVRV